MKKGRGIRMIALSIVVGFIGFGILFIKVRYPPFGRKVSKERRSKFKQSENFSEKRKFVNLIPTVMFSTKDMGSMLVEFIKAIQMVDPRKRYR